MVELTVPTIPAMTTPTQKGTFGPPIFENIVAAGITFADVFVDHWANTIIDNKMTKTIHPLLVVTPLIGSPEP